MTQISPIQSNQNLVSELKGGFKRKTKGQKKTRSGRQFTAEEPPSRRSRKRMLRFVQIYATLGLIESVNQNQISSLDCLRNKRKRL